MDNKNETGRKISTWLSPITWDKIDQIRERTGFITDTDVLQFAVFITDEIITQCNGARRDVINERCLVVPAPQEGATNER